MTGRAVRQAFAHWRLQVRPFGLDVLRVSQADSFNLLLAINAIGAPGRFVPAVLADQRIVPGGTLTMLIITTVGAGGCLFAWARVGSLASDLAWTLAFGYFGAGIQSLFPAALVGFSDDASRDGVRIGMVFSIVSVATVSGPPLAGQLIEMDGGGYLGVQMWGGSTLMVSAAVLVLARIMTLRPK